MRIIFLCLLTLTNTYIECATATTEYQSLNCFTSDGQINFNAILDPTPFQDNYFQVLNAKVRDNYSAAELLYRRKPR